MSGYVKSLIFRITEVNDAGDLANVEWVSYGKVYYPGERAVMRRDEAYATGGVEIVDEIYEYLKSDAIHFDRYDHKNRFAD